MSAFLQRSRHGTIFYFRRKVPLEIRPQLGSPQFYITLGTSVRSTAEVLARRAATLCDELFVTLKKMPKKKPDTALMRLIEQRRLTAPLKEEIEQLREELLEFQYQGGKALRQQREDHATQLAAVVSAKGAASSVSPGIKGGLTIGKAIQDYLGKGMKPESRKRMTPALKHFEDFVGAVTPISDITQARFSDYADHVNSTVGWKDGTKRLTITAAGSMLGWHASRGRAVRVSAATLKPARTTPASMDRDAFTLDQLQVVFTEAAEFRVSEPHWFWVVVLSAFMGTRIEELAQADIQADFKKDKATGRWYLDINENVGPGGHKKSVKKESGWRVVPLHRQVIDLGFLAYLESRRKAGARTLFEKAWTPLKQAEKDAYKFSHGITKRGSRALARLDRDGKLARGKTSFFHSLRHTFISHLAEKGVGLELRCAISGHKPEGGGMNAARYTKLKANVKPMLAAIDGNLGEFVTLLRAALKTAR